MATIISDPARLLGRYYTPGFIVEAMLRLALDPLLESHAPIESPQLRILDPACGEGAFLLPVGERLNDWYEDHGVADRCRVAPHVFGVDVDRTALTRLRKRFKSDYGKDSAWQAQIRWGDALTGPGFGEPSVSGGDHPKVPDLDWQAAFADVAGSGGFDLVIGNPPYRRELASKTALERLRQSPLGMKWHQPRLDLWAYFLHRGLDVLKPGGRLAFILPSYWTASTAARQLIDRLEAEATLREIVLLGNSPVFPNVAGRHLILSLVKGRQNDACQVWDLSSCGKQVVETLRHIPKSTRGPLAYSLKQNELYEHHQVRLLSGNSRVLVSGEQFFQPLRERFEVRQGIVENPRRITRKMATASAHRFQIGEGVFVLSAEELNRLELSIEETQLLRPYYRGTDIERYRIAVQPAEWLLYLSRETAPDLAAFPRIADHLARFRPLLESRREVKLGRIAWWHLHWPREEELFLAPRIVMPQMGPSPRFVFCEQPAFVGFAMHVVRERPGVESTSPKTLLTLTGILNSAWAAKWFWREAKHRGTALDISGTVLNRFPLPMENPEAESALAALVEHRQALSITSDEARDVDEEIEAAVRKWYAGGG